MGPPQGQRGVGDVVGQPRGEAGFPQNDRQHAVDQERPEDHACGEGRVRRSSPIPTPATAYNTVTKAMLATAAATPCSDGSTAMPRLASTTAPPPTITSSTTTARAMPEKA